METVAERMAYHFIGHHPTMPGSSKTAQALDRARYLEDSAHASMMTSVPRPGSTTPRRVRPDYRGVMRLSSIGVGGCPQSARLEESPTITRNAKSTSRAFFVKLTDLLKIAVEKPTSGK
jgi:hypothetical protein